jgi:hypothetical protein
MEKAPVREPSPEAKLSQRIPPLNALLDVFHHLRGSASSIKNQGAEVGEEHRQVARRQFSPQVSSISDHTTPLWSAGRPYLCRPDFDRMLQCRSARGTAGGRYGSSAPNAAKHLLALREQIPPARQRRSPHDIGLFKSLSGRTYRAAGWARTVRGRLVGEFRLTPKLEKKS